MGMIPESLIEVFERDLDQLAREVDLYPTEEGIWAKTDGINNPGGNLVLHLTGNLQHFIGTVLGGTDFKRDRDAEFSLKDIPRAQLLAQIEETKKVIAEVLPKLTEEDLEKIYPINVLRENMKTGFFLIHLAGHLNYHLGQLHYHRRLIGS